MSQFLMDNISITIFLHYQITLHPNTVRQTHLVMARCSNNSNYSNCPHKARVSPDMQSTEQENSKPVGIQTRGTPQCPLSMLPHIIQSHTSARETRFTIETMTYNNVQNWRLKCPTCYFTSVIWSISIGNEISIKEIHL